VDSNPPLTTIRVCLASTTTARRKAMMADARPPSLELFKESGFPTVPSTDQSPSNRSSTAGTPLGQGSPFHDHTGLRLNTGPAFTAVRRGMGLS